MNLFLAALFTQAGYVVYPSGQDVYPTGQDVYPSGQDVYPSGQDVYPSGQDARTTNLNATGCCLEHLKFYVQVVTTFFFRRMAVPFSVAIFSSSKPGNCFSHRLTICSSSLRSASSRRIIASSLKASNRRGNAG